MAKSLAGVLAVSIAAMLFAGCGGGSDFPNPYPSVGGSEARSGEPVVDVETWCQFLYAGEALYMPIESCLIDEDVRKSLPRSQEQVEGDMQYYLIRFGFIKECFENMKRAEAANGRVYGSPPLERDSVRVRNCAKNAIDDLKLRLAMGIISGFNESQYFDQLEGTKPPQRDGGYLIDGDIYNDPWGLDYRNDSSDVYGDGR
jgi:hypothetical protein